MSTFNAEGFMAEPDLTKFDELRKDDLILLGRHLNLEIRGSMRKREIQRTIMEHLVNKSTFEPSALETYQITQTNNVVEISNDDANNEIDKVEKDRQWQREQWQREQEKRQWEREKIELERELEREREERQIRLQQLELQKLELQAKTNENSISYSRVQFDVTKHIRMVPPFQEREVDKYFLHFEKVANNCRWPKENWTMLLQSVLIGKAREIFSQLSIEDSANYDTVKELILKGYELVPEAYRQKFRSLTKTGNRTFTEFAQEKAQLFDRWCASEKIDSNYENLRELILIEEFKNCLSTDIRTFVTDQKANKLTDAARLADNYSLTHKFSAEVKRSNQSVFPRDNNNNQPQFQRYIPPPKRAQGRYPENFNPNNRPRDEVFKSKQNSPFQTVVCNFCKRKGHTMSECYALKNKQPNKLTGFVSSDKKLDTPSFSREQRKQTFDEKHANLNGKIRADPIMKIFEPFVYDATVSLTTTPLQATPIKILRDTGASQSLILTKTLPFSTQSYSGTNVLIKGVHSSEYSPIPLHNIELQSDLVSGNVAIGIIESLPFDGIQLILGNDLAGEKVKVNPVLSNTPCTKNIFDETEQEIPNLFPSCAVTRAMAKKQISNDRVDQYDLTDTFLKRIFDSTDKHELTTSNLINEQKADPETASLIAQACDEEEINVDGIGYFIKNEILMRKWRPTEACADDEWSVQYQIVIPKSFRAAILSLAHETPLAGHLGINKTHEKIVKHFYWPGIRKDVAKFCRTCHICQVVGKPNQTIPKAPLSPIPAFDEPFSRIIIDCVGPLPKTKKGNQYLLTIMCASTRFPEAIPLRNITAKTVVQALTKFFTLVGLPKSIQSDQGSNFMSGLFQQVMYALGIKQYKSTAYHPETQGALERFHQTLKNMIRTYCLETEKDWDDGIHLLLFAARESVQDSLGFSPFELVFGHRVRGPLVLLKEKLLSTEGGSLNLLEYVSNFRTRLTKACDLARKNLHSAQNRMKQNYDKTSVPRKFQPGDKVLAFLPVSGRPLQARYSGPYVVEKKESELNYVIVTPDRRKHKQLCHVNMLKPYSERTKAVMCMESADIDNSNNNEDLFNLSESTKLKNSDIFNNLDDKLKHLPSSQCKDLKQILTEYKGLFPDVPSRTDMIYHDVDIINDASPIKQHPYRLSPVKQKFLKEEVEYLLENDLIEPSRSNWSSPCILVPKPDGSYRMCTDYRKVNHVTKSDTFPIPRMDDCIDRIGNAQYVTKFDLLKGFWQVPLTDRAKEISAFVTPSGLYQYKVMPFGMKNSPATFQRLINTLVAEIDGCEAYIDDVIIYSSTWEEHLNIIRQLFQQLSQAKLTINLAKSEFGCATVTYLGHIVGQGTVKPVDAKISAISQFPPPVSKKQVMRFLGMAGYYRKFCPNFSSITEPLTRLLGKNVKFEWTSQCEDAFEKLKAVLVNTPVLTAPDFNRPFKLAVDASDVAVGAVLLQESSDGIDHPVCYFSRKLSKCQKNYSTIEKELLALILALQHFDVYVTSSSSPVVVFSDHNPLVFLHKLKDKNQRLLRWSLLLQEYNLEIQHIKGTDNLIADCLSRV